MHAEWLIEGRACQVIVPSVVDVPMLLAYDAQIISLMDTASSTVHVVVDVGTMDVIPSINHWLSLKMMRHPHFGQTLLIGLENKPVLRFFVSVVSQSAHVPVKNFSTIQAALAYVDFLQET